MKQQLKIENEIKRDKYVHEKWEEDKVRYSKGIRKLLWTFVITIIPIVSVIIINHYQLKINEILPFPNAALILSLVIGVLSAISIIHRLIVDKSLISDGWRFFTTSFNQHKLDLLKKERFNKHKIDYDNM